MSGVPHWVFNCPVCGTDDFLTSELPRRYCEDCGVPLKPTKESYNTQPERNKAMSDNIIPRRCYVDKMTPAELAIRQAVLEVEKVGAHPLLTDAVILLGQAKDKVSDYEDRKD